MSAVLTQRRRSRPRRPARRAGDIGEQATLFAASAPAAVPDPATAARAVAPEPVDAPEPAASPHPSSPSSARRHGTTLDDVVVGAWEGLLAGAPADCLVCRTVLTPRHSAGAGVVGGRCGGCGSTLG